jgi:prevent-host-death family protein
LITSREEEADMTKNIPAFIARTQFSQILDRVSKANERFIVTKKGEAKAIILGVEDFLQATGEPPVSLTALHQQAKKSGANKLTLEEVEKEIDAVRKAPTKEYAPSRSV